MNNCGSGVGGGVPITVGAYDTKIAGLYDLLDTLGSGHFAVVKLARHVFTGEKVAVKVIDKSKLDDVSKSHLFQEVRCMKLVQHPNVVRLYEVIDTQTKLYLILELGDGGDLYDYIMRHESGLSESLARDYFRQIVRAISYCHRLHVVHRDLKPENVVFFEKLGVVKLTDFGFSNKFCPGQKLETSCGSLAYSAPEILLGDSYDAPAVDVWSLGVILYMLVCGQAPFQEANDSETLTMIMDCKYTMPAHVSTACKRLIGRMLVREPEKRATLAEIATDPWITAGEGVTIEDFDTPLVAKQDLTEEDRSAILQRMVNGAMATKEHILEELEKNEYNHITATYYLLAERKLRSKRQEARQSARRPEVLGVSRTSRGLLAPPQLSAAPRTPQDVPPRSRKCSIVREEEDDEEGAAAAPAARCADARRGSRSEGRLHLARPAQLADNLTKVNLDEGASEVTNAATQPECALRAPPAPAPARRQRIECRRRRARAGSCSSSDLSDDDSEKKKRAGEQAPAPGERARRDSHDDSSDSQERGAARRPAPRPPPAQPAPTHGTEEDLRAAAAAAARRGTRAAAARGARAGVGAAPPGRRAACGSRARSTASLRWRRRARRAGRAAGWWRCAAARCCACWPPRAPRPPRAACTACADCARCRCLPTITSRLSKHINACYFPGFHWLLRAPHPARSVLTASAGPLRAPGTCPDDTTPEPIIIIISRFSSSYCNKSACVRDSIFEHDSTKEKLHKARIVSTVCPPQRAPST